MRLHELPDDILVLVLSQCDTETIFAVQATCTSLRAVICEYIATIAAKASRNTYPGCEQLTLQPEEGYSLEWLRGLEFRQLASIMLDKDKLRMHPYIFAGFPYGIPSESDCGEAKAWRIAISTGWWMVSTFSMISRSVYGKEDSELQRPNVLRRASSSIKSSKWWQVMACPYAGCTEHGVKQILKSDSRQDKKQGDDIEIMRIRESIILEERLAVLEKMPDQALVYYTYLWRLLSHVFRPYEQPQTGSRIFFSVAYTDGYEPPHWESIIRDIPNGCSWLNWWVLSVGPAPFIKQWSLRSSSSHLIAHIIQEAHRSRSSHQIEIEREYACKFEFALRKRCLSAERLKRLEFELNTGRSIRTISLDCIPWRYDMYYKVQRPASDFPWYTPDQYVWLDDEWLVKTRPGIFWASPGELKRSMVQVRWEAGKWILPESLPIVQPDGSVQHIGQGPLAKVPYLVYLGDFDLEKLNDRAGGTMDWLF